MFQGDQDSLQTGNCQKRVNASRKLGASESNGNPISLSVYPGVHHAQDHTKFPASGGMTKSDVYAKYDNDHKVIIMINKFLFDINYDIQFLLKTNQSVIKKGKS